MAEPILLLAHEDREKLLAANVVIEYDEDEPLFDPEKSDTVFKEIAIEKGDVDCRPRRARTSIVEGTYRTGHQEHVYIEPNGVIAVPERTAASRSTARCSVPTTSSRRSAACSAPRIRTCAWSRPRPAADSAARKSIRR